MKAVALQAPLTGGLIDTERASRTPLTSVVPTALTHEPLVTSDADALLVTSYVVEEVVFTVVVRVAPPKVDFTANDVPVIEAIWPNVPEKRAWNVPVPPPLPNRLGNAEPDGNGRGVGPDPNPPGGGVPLNERVGPPNRPDPLACWQPEVLVTVTDRAVSLVGSAGAPPVDPLVAVAAGALPSPVPATVTQSPLASEERVVVEVEVKRVWELKSTVDGPLVCCTEALFALAAMTLPDTESNDRVVAPVPPSPEDVVAVAGDEPPHPAAKTATTVPPTAIDTSRDPRRDAGDTLTPLVGRDFGCCVI